MNNVDSPESWLRDCIFGHPSRPDAAEAAWITSTVLEMARHIHGERSFEIMPILADALEDAGCDDPVMIAHCRSEKPHARGCWVIGLLTDRS